MVKQKNLSDVPLVNFQIMVIMGLDIFSSSYETLVVSTAGSRILLNNLLKISVLY